MGISERERQALRSIEDRLAGSDPPLASMLAKFGRMTSGQAMPMRERIRARRRQARSSWRRAHPPSRLTMLLHSVRKLRLAPGWQPAILVLVIFAGLLTVALVLGASGHSA